MTVFVHQAELELGDDADERAPGGAVTVALCGHWDHDGTCRWPHHSQLDVFSGTSRLRTVFVAPERDAAEVRRRIDAALADNGSWVVQASGPVDPTRQEQELGERLAAPPEDEAPEDEA